MTSDSVYLQVSKAGFEQFVLCLALGTLEAIRSNALHPDAGIWTIGRPKFSGQLEKCRLTPQVMAVIQQMDELSALRELAGVEVFNRNLDQSIAILKDRLRELPNEYWQAGWIDWPDA